MATAALQTGRRRSGCGELRYRASGTIATRRSTPAAHREFAVRTLRRATAEAVLAPSLAPTPTGGLGILSSVSDLPKTRALGIELRASAVLAAPVSITDGSFVEEPLRIYYDLTGGPVQSLRNLSDALLKIVDHFAWKAVVGCSITKEVAKRLGVDSNDFGTLEKQVGSIMAKIVKDKVVFCHTVVHTDAAGYNELVWGSNASQDLWRGKNVLICTLGKHLGAVLFNDGRRVQNSPIMPIAELPGELRSGKFFSPEVGTPEFRAWVEQIDRLVHDIQVKVSDIDRIIFLPTGRTARPQALPLTEALPSNLPRTHEVADRIGCELTFSEQTQGSVVRGVALCALVELETMQVLRSMESVLNGGDALHLLSEGQLKLMYDKVDVNCTGGASLGDIQKALEVLGIQRDIKTLEHDFLHSPGGVVSFADFARWWDQEVVRARIVRVTSADAWKGLLARRPPPGYGELVLLEITFTFCRSCRRFEAVFHKKAEEYPEVRFAQIVGNGTVGAMDFCTKELGVTTSPTFFMFRRGGELVTQWSGANAEKFDTHLQECIRTEHARNEHGKQ